MRSACAAPARAQPSHVHTLARMGWTDLKGCAVAQIHCSAPHCAGQLATTRLRPPHVYECTLVHESLCCGRHAVCRFGLCEVVVARCLSGACFGGWGVCTSCAGLRTICIFSCRNVWDVCVVCACVGAVAIMYTVVRWRLLVMVAGATLFGINTCECCLTYAYHAAM